MGERTRQLKNSSKQYGPRQLSGLGDTRNVIGKQDRSHENLRGFDSFLIGVPVVIAALGFGVFDLIQHYSQ